MQAMSGFRALGLSDVQVAQDTLGQYSHELLFIFYQKSLHFPISSFLNI